jgi:hypothetical protein
MKSVKSVDLRELQSVINRILEHIIETKGVKRIDLKKDFYWTIPTEGLYQMEEEPKQLDVGSLYDDLEFVRGLTNIENDPVAYQLTEVAPLLRYLGEVVKES